jgi:YhcH/YjgK/YiaL family protein
MFVGNIEAFEKEQNLFLPTLQKALNYLKNNDFNKKEIGREEIDGDNMFAMVQEYQTKPKAECKPEAHVKYVDIQYIVSGKEGIGYGPLSDKNPVKEDKLAEKDIIFYQTVENESDVVLGQGMYGIYYPSDVHRPKCAVGESTTVRKVVVKIKASTLGI